MYIFINICGKKMDGRTVGLYQIGKGVKGKPVFLSTQLENGLEILMIKVILLRNLVVKLCIID